jgi:hypothetical protein
MMEYLIVAALVIAIAVFLLKKKSSTPANVETSAPVAETEQVVEVAPVVEVVPAGTEATMVKVHKKGTKDPRDTDHNGVTSDEEKRAAALADARDTNHDGVVDSAEKSAAKKKKKTAAVAKSRAKKTAE